MHPPGRAAGAIPVETGWRVTMVRPPRAGACLCASCKRFLASATVSAVSFVLTYLVCEFLFFRFMLPYMSYNIRPYLPDRADFFMQNSKDHYVPHDYIALLGDSYAAGGGDWLLAGGGLSDKPYHSANVIHDLTHRDVASFGRVNIGSAQMMVDRVARILDDDYCYLFPPIEVPRRFVVYFYEGNDISDNYELMLDDIKPHDGPLAPQIDGFLRTRYAKPNAWACHGHFGDMLWRMGRYAVKYSWRPPAVIDLPGTMNPVIVDGITRTGGEWQAAAPPLSRHRGDDRLCPGAADGLPSRRRRGACEGGLRAERSEGADLQVRAGRAARPDLRPQPVYVRQDPRRRDCGRRRLHRCPPRLPPRGGQGVHPRPARLEPSEPAGLHGARHPGRTEDRPEGAGCVRRQLGVGETTAQRQAAVDFFSGLGRSSREISSSAFGGLNR